MLLKIWLLHGSEAINLTAGGIISCEYGNQNRTGLCFQMFAESCGKNLGPNCGSEWDQPWGKAWGAQEAEITDLRCYMCNCDHVLRWQSSVKKKWVAALNPCRAIRGSKADTEEADISISCLFADQWGADALKLCAWLSNGGAYFISRIHSQITQHFVERIFFLFAAMRNSSHHKNKSLAIALKGALEIHYRKTFWFDVKLLAVLGFPISAGAQPFIASIIHLTHRSEV